jgi:hypothetical protein
LKAFAAWLWSVLDTAVVASLLIAAAAWLARTWIKGRLTENLRRETEERLLSLEYRLQIAEAQVHAVRQAGIDTNLQLNAVVVGERVAACKQLWHGVVDWKSATMVVMAVHAFDLEYVRRYAADEGVKRTFKTMLEAVRYMDLMTRMNAIQQCRPFVTERAWALFFAYHGYFVSGLVRGFSLMIGARDLAESMWQANAELAIVREAAPPDMFGAYEANPIANFLPFVNYLEREILVELQKSLAGEQSGPEASRQAARLVATAETALQQATKAQAGEQIELPRPDARA